MQKGIIAAPVTSRRQPHLPTLNKQVRHRTHGPTTFLARPSLIALVVLLIAAPAMQAQARPQTRFDETTQTCRVLDDGQLEWESSAWGKGGKLFQNLCQSCHTRDNDKGASFLWVESKTSKAWNRVFTQKYPACAKDGSWQSMTMDDQLMLNDYLYRWAKNSQDINDNC